MDYVLVRIQSSIYLTARNRMETLKKTIVRYGKEKREGRFTNLVMLEDETYFIDKELCAFFKVTLSNRYRFLPMDPELMESYLKLDPVAREEFARKHFSVRRSFPPLVDILLIVGILVVLAYVLFWP
ncbi:MAG: hypothetical protein LKE39_08785 [Sphaerochaeta sp.]|jgi:hypothetical protein|nr:hypothetical protein [Sphaerochaeta sp.]MCH3920540.1 hypothetical protein [Sphaerochaeta sp.]MCI2103521.1 hypothetical protein [Sphaerochaeta sp.]MCI2127984.1 hypothetical protein [Sphaerochaeta sp.]